MIATLQWVTLAVCAGVTIARLPSALRRENRALFYIFALLTLAILLSIEAPYLAIDGVLGGVNVANLVLRFVIFGAIFFVGVKIAKGFGAKREYALLTGKPGMIALAVCSIAVIGTFLLMDTSGSSAGLVQVAAKSDSNATLVEYYGAAGRLYPSYVAAVLVPAMFGAAARNLPWLVRVGALLLGIGSVAIILTLSFPWLPPALGPAEFVTNYTAILCYVVGLTLIWIAKLRTARQRSKKSFTKK
ncbi:hypothetical protein V1639_00325 [Pseudarthrobacter sp. J75]|uniref:hypothetical protein n=1 Tax=unclassified Pseudarthrobacter TaxID=2647000 RepID=UPI002E80FA03|nr:MULTISPECIES: hypothetical protein [unclassified Pseudarthrobacter]MEE2523218.1 hypothetical protein [Pseudarthrobacter sp. J47]MEE2527473.1 hypothetical protein [Pseudarthrobacter sp. J75]MEE2569830.1 hypothetical protein [Pseudarthrobacter sp. J64]